MAPRARLARGAICHAEIDITLRDIRHIRAKKKMRFHAVRQCRPTPRTPLLAKRWLRQVDTAAR